MRSYITRPIKRVALRGRITRPWWRWRFHEFGQGSILHRPDWVFGPHLMSVGSGVMIFHGTWLSVERAAWGAEEPVLRIGDGVGIRPYCTISAAESIVIEDHVVLSAFSTVLDSDHTFVRGEPSGRGCARQGKQPGEKPHPTDHQTPHPPHVSKNPPP